MLGATGETFWHVNSAAAARSGAPLSIVAAVAGHAAATNALASAASSAKSAMLTGDPIFKPFVMVHIELPDGYSSGEVMDVNDAGQAVGWMHYDGDDTERAFFFDPAESSNASHGVTILNFNPTYNDSTRAYSLTNESTPTIAGAVMWKGSPNFLRACTWPGPTGTINIPLSSGTVSEAFAIADVSSTATFAGRYEVSGQSRSVVYDGSEAYPASGVEGEARGINEGGEVVGWHMVSGDSHAYSWEPNTTTDIHPGGWDESSALAINGDGDIAGWVSNTPGIEVPAFWYNTGANFYTVSIFTSIGSSSRVCDLNSHGEMAVTNMNGAGGGAIWQVIDDEDVAYNLNVLTLMPNDTGAIYSARAINEHMWIGGSYKATSGGDPQPCLVIPYDVNNNGEPDYREIVNDIEDDFNENWLLDWGETIDSVGMRVGLNEPGYDKENINKSHDIENTQIVSLPLQIGSLPEDATSDDYAIEDVLDGQPDCETFRSNLEEWSRVTMGDPQEREISLLFRSTLGGEIGHDNLPDEMDKAQLLANIKKFGYEYAQCIDYVQTGNEVFGGAGGYQFTPDQLPTCAGNNLGWTSGTKTFQQLGQLSEDCQKEAVDVVLEWLEDQAWAVLEGSALAGRPLRLVGPGVIYTHVHAAHEETGAVALYIMQHLVPWLNEKQMHFDMHLHYRTISEGTTAISDLSDSDPSWGDPVNWRVSREWGPTASDAWETNNSSEYAKFRNDMGCTGDPPNCCTDTPPSGDWDTFTTTGWRDVQFSGDFQMDTFLGAMANAGWIWVAYGPVHMDAPATIIYDVAALRANRVCNNFLGSNRSTSTRFTPLTDEFQTEAAYYQINFPETRQDCPDCPGN